MLVQKCVHKQDVPLCVGGATIKFLASSLHGSFDCIFNLQCMEDERSDLFILKCSTNVSVGASPCLGSCDHSDLMNPEATNDHSVYSDIN